MKNEAVLTGKRWDFSADGYNDIIQQEFKETGTVWVDILRENMPEENCVALDIGTGPGFFAMILSMLGCEMHGIDCSAEMLKVAANNAKARGLTIDFRQMDSHSLEFADNSFDYIVARNATWLLYEPEKAFAEWLRVLKPGGRLMYIDANWPNEDNPELNEHARILKENYEQKYGKKFNSYTGDDETNEAFQNVVAFKHIWRPEWDEKKLPEIGFVNVNINKRINERIYPEWKMMLYGYMDVFLITAEKGC